MTIHKVRSRAAIAACTGFSIFATSLLGGCATQRTTRPGFIDDYAGLTPASTEVELGVGRIKAQRPVARMLAHHDSVLVEPVVAKANDLDADQIGTLAVALSQALSVELGEQGTLVDRPEPTALRVRVAVTDVPQASSPPNTPTIALVRSMSNGGGADEAHILDHQSGRGLAALIWADQRRFSEVTGLHRATGHARSLMPGFAAVVANLVARQ
ncbi:MAG: DUF3313 family protein [Rhodospirillales bacterium]|jgi:hypothetical protein